MKIKEINLYGFKSFPESTKIVLNTGITAFVGPNGSGKSNIFDALRWIFGEQSMKALRCERIEDLIYVSPDAKDDANFTEVTVTIDNEDYFTQFGGEFEIKRRFYRSSESEFFLNRVKCRLQDIQALFVNSGTLTYSFLELSEIEKIIHGDTKHMFNDVSGILKYQERREQTKRRLESTEQDLLRLEDIIHEMQRSLRSLRRQVRQTKLYQELRDEYKVLMLFIFKNEYNQTLKKLTKIQEQIDSTEIQRQTALQEIKKLGKDRERLKNEMEQIDTRKKDTLSQVVACNEAIELLQKEIGEKEEQSKLIILSRERTITSIKEKEEILKSSTERLTEYGERSAELLSKIGTAKDRIKVEQEQLDAKNNAYFLLRDNLREKEEALTQCMNKIQQREQDIAKLQFEKDNIGVLLSRISQECSAQREEIEGKQRVKKQLEDELERIINQQDELTKRLDDANKELIEREQTLNDLETDLKDRQEGLTECKVVVDTLTHRLREKNAVKEIEEQFEKRSKGLFKNSINVAPGYEAVVDICLGDILNFYLLEGYIHDDFDRLPEGRFGFIKTNAVVQEKKLTEPPEGALPISQYAQVKSSHKMLQRYIDNYYLVDDFNKANGFSERFPGCGFVTPDGILFKNGTIIVERGEIGYFKISQSLGEHKRKLETIQNEILFMNEEKKRLLSERDIMRDTIEDEKNQIFSVNVKKSECSLRLNEVTRHLEKIKKEHESFKMERDSLKKECELIEKRIEEQANEIQAVKDGNITIKNEKNSLIEKSQNLKSEIEETQSLLNEWKMELVALEERQSSVDATLEQLKSAIARVDAEISTLKQNRIAENLEEIKTQIRSFREDLEAKKREKAGIESRLPDSIIEDLTQNLNDIFDRLAEKQKIHEEIQNTIMQLKYESFQLNHKKDEAIKRAQEDFKVDLRDYIPEEEFSDEETRLSETKGKLEKLGEINPLSLELYENEKKRLDEFLKQRDDIITARRSLLNSIEELDRRARERFVDVFGQVKKEFDFVFSNFFEGGQADLLLTDSDNPLTSKVEIVVRMKGKRLKTINQLSGGERTLLAISLLLAFYLVKPAPFCILDEIDAPLDDANVVRFNKFLRDLSQRTQVVIITHNRATMEYADYLYGVTMENPGQSKIISARLADLEKIELNV